MDSQYDHDKCYCRVSYHWNISIQQKCIVTSFRVRSSEAPSKFNPRSLCEGKKLKFIPVYSSASPAQSKSIPSSSSFLYGFTEAQPPQHKASQFHHLAPISLIKKLLSSQRDVAKGMITLQLLGPTWKGEEKAENMAATKKDTSLKKIPTQTRKGTLKEKPP